MHPFRYYPKPIQQNNCTFKTKIMEHKIIQELTIDNPVHYDMVVFAIQTMDIQRLDQILDDTFTFSNLPKDVFLSNADETFFQYKAKGDSFLNKVEGFCRGCQVGHSGYRFVGNISKCHMDLIIRSQKGKVTDLYTCTFFTPSLKIENLGRWLGIRAKAPESPAKTKRQ